MGVAGPPRHWAPRGRALSISKNLNDEPAVLDLHQTTACQLSHRVLWQHVDGVVSQPCCLSNFFFSVGVGKISAFSPSRLLSRSGHFGRRSRQGGSRQEGRMQRDGWRQTRSQEGRRVRSDVDKKHSSMQPQASQPKLAIEEEQRTILVFKE
jgi:hypothetical protein